MVNQPIFEGTYRSPNSPNHRPEFFDKNEMPFSPRTIIRLSDIERELHEVRTAIRQLAVGPIDLPDANRTGRRVYLAKGLLSVADFAFEVQNRASKEQITALDVRTRRIESQLTELSSNVAKLILAAGGGTWHTADGRTLAIRDMSTGHLKNTLAGSFGTPSTRAHMKDELDRRRVERSWRWKDRRRTLLFILTLGFFGKR